MLSRYLVPEKYKSLNRRDRLSWDAHVVSMYQSLFINTVALWVIFTDPQRALQNGDWRERLWGYNGAGGMVQGFAAGYFLWDVFISVVHFDVLGFSSLVHGVCALGVTCIGFVSGLSTCCIDCGKKVWIIADAQATETFCQLLRPQLHPL